MSPASSVVLGEGLGSFGAAVREHFWAPFGRAGAPARRRAKARIVLEVVTKLDEKCCNIAARLEDAEALASEWRDAGGSGLAESVDLVRALERADTAEALNRAMAKAVAGIHVVITVDGRLRAEFALRAIHDAAYFFQHLQPVGLAAERITLPDTPAESHNLVTSDLPAEPCGSPRSTAV